MRLQWGRRPLLDEAGAAVRAGAWRALADVNL